MPRAKTPRNNEGTSATPARSKQIIPMPETGSPVLLKKNTSDGNGRSADLETAIRQRAYELYEQRGRGPGREQEDWFRAEEEISAQHHDKSRQQSA